MSSNNSKNVNRKKRKHSVFNPNKHSYDDCYNAPLWLQGVKSVAPEDRNRVFRPKNYNKILKELRAIDQKTKIELNHIVLDQTLLENKLAELAALNPVSVEMRISGIGRIQGKDQYSKLRAILLYIETQVENEYVRMILMEPFLKLIPRRSSEPGIQAELKFLEMVLSLEINQRKDTIRKIYSRHNLNELVSRGRDLCSGIVLHLVDTRPIIQSQRKRGYNDKGSTSLISDKERKICMKEINTSFEERKQRVLKKQLELFERNLDKLLQIDAASNRTIIKKIIQDRDEELEEINEEYIQSIEELRGKNL